VINAELELALIARIDMELRLFARRKTAIGADVEKRLGRERQRWCQKKCEQAEKFQSCSRRIFQR